MMIRTLEELLARCREVPVSAHDSASEEEIAAAVVRILGAKQPCQREMPDHVGIQGSEFVVMVRAPRFDGSPDEARAFAAAIVIAADDVDGGAR